MTVRSGRRRGQLAADAQSAPKAASTPRAAPDSTPAPSPVWSALTLLPNPLPEIALANVDTSVRFLGREISLPVLLLAPQSSEELGKLAALAQSRRLPLSIGDVSALATDPALPASLQGLRLRAPDAILLGEIPATALVPQPDQAAHDLDRLSEATHQAGLSGLIVRLDFDQAVLAGNSTPDATGALDAIAALIRRLRLPVLVRCASGLARHTARGLVERGVAGLLVAGTGPIPTAAGGGTPAPEQSQPRSLATVFAGWGIPTVAAIRMLRSVGAPVISDGAVETGLDAAKAIALGADLIALTPPADSSLSGEDALAAWLDTFTAEIRAAMFLAGALRIGGLRQIPFVATGETREWLEAAESLWRTDVGD